MGRQAERWERLARRCRDYSTLWLLQLRLSILREKLFEYGADFIVAGAYGHARLREWMFGGFTHDLLYRSPLCSFLAH